MPTVNDVLRRYLDWVGEGQRESDLPKYFKRIHKLAQRMRYVEVTRVGRGWVINQTGKQP